MNLSTLRLSVTRRIAVSILLLLPFNALPVFAQSASTGTITGTVSDPQGALIQGTSVTVTDLSTKEKRTTLTNGRGLFVLQDIPTGNYEVTASKRGFSKEAMSITVKVGTQTTADFNLRVGSDTTIVEVEATNTDLQTLNASVSETVEPAMVNSLPSIGRDVSTFAALQPGVTPAGNVAGTVQDQAVYQLDGGDNSSDMDGSMESYTGSFGNSTTGGFLTAGSSGVMPMPQDSVEEFKVSTAGQTADFNNSSGLQSQVVTKRGHDNWNGTAYEYYLDSHFGANTWQNNFPAPLYTAKPDYHYSRFGIAGGGPIAPVKFGGKTYLFANYEGFRYPAASTFERAVPSAAMMAGNLTFNGTTYTAAQLKADDPRGIGMDSTIQAMWAKYLPQQGTSYPGGVFDPSCGSISTSYCDGVNTIGYKANISIPQSSNFGVIRLDHDFGQKWHYNASFHYYKLTQLTTNQVDIGGFFSGDKLGVPAALDSRPQDPVFFATGMTTNISSTFTNDFHYSFLRNYWQWKDDAAPAQITGAGGAIEPMGDGAASTGVLSPFNLDTQDIRTRIWDGMDNLLRDDLTKLAGNHLIQFGGQFEHKFAYHQRTDNGASINYTTTYQIGDASGGGTIAYTGLSAAGLPTSNTVDGRIIDTYYGMVTDTQVANTYSESSGSLTLNPPLTAIGAHTSIPYYNFYATDTWHMKRSFTVSYGLSYAIEMPPIERNGNQVMWVDANNNPIQVQSYLAARSAAAESGQAYNPEIGFSLIKNVPGRKYPYDPFYGAVSPRVSAAWSPKFSNPMLTRIFGDTGTVIRGGYGRIYGRINGNLEVLNPMLSPGLILAVQCHTPQANGTCTTSNFTDSTAFRFGSTSSSLDGLTAPLASAPSTLPQPYFPGYSGPSVALASPLDPTLRPNDADTFNLSIQRQLNPRMMVEVGYIGRLIHHEYTMLNPDVVPYMMSMGGQSFATAYLAVEQALGCTTSASACSANATAAGKTAATKLAFAQSVPKQAFFESALSSTYCNIATYGSCTAAVIDQQLSNFSTQKVYTLWSALDNGDFNFGRTMMNTPVAGQAYGTNGQLVSGLSVGTAAAWSNYNGGYVSFKTAGFHGLTMQENLTYSKALGVYAYAQSTSEAVPNDSFDLKKNYGVQTFNQKFIFNTFLVWDTPWYRNQSGLLGRIAGGWTISPLLTAGTGLPLSCTTNSTSQSFGGADANNFSDKEQCVFTTPYTGGYHTHAGVLGGIDPHGISVGTSVKGTGGAAQNMFSNPVAVYDSVRAPILGLDERDGGTGPINGLPYLNLDASIKKKLIVRENDSLEFTGVFYNMMNHLDFSNPSLSMASPTSFGVTKTQGNSPREIQIGLRASF